jgi:hypothetical protein
MSTYQIWCDIESGSKGVQLNVENPPFAWNIAFEDGRKASATLHLCNGKNALITIECDRQPENIEGIIKVAVQHVQALYDAALFTCGISGMIIARAVLLPDGKMANILFNDVGQLIDYNAIGITVEQITRCSIDSEIVRMCLQDLRNASLNLQDAGMLCYRAIETVMQDYKATDEEESKVTWPKVQNSLHFEKSFVDPVNEYSKSNRHGKPVYLSTAIARDIIRRSLTIIGRYARVKVLSQSISDEEVLK